MVIGTAVADSFRQTLKQLWRHRTVARGKNSRYAAHQPLRPFRVSIIAWIDTAVSSARMSQEWA
ncbi:MAG: hypothetical protein RIE16_07195, partial [Rhodospirillales bacterium]